MDLSLLQAAIPPPYVAPDTIGYWPDTIGEMCYYTALYTLNSLYDSKVYDSNGRKKKSYQKPPYQTYDLSISDFLNVLTFELEKTDAVIITVENGNWIPSIPDKRGWMADGDGDTSELAHVFVLAMVDDLPYRIESYVIQYHPRILPWPMFKEDLIYLSDATPGQDRLDKWNLLFGSDERVDDQHPLKFHVYSYRTRELVS